MNELKIISNFKMTEFRFLLFQFLVIEDLCIWIYVLNFINDYVEIAKLRLF